MASCKEPGFCLFLRYSAQRFFWAAAIRSRAARLILRRRGFFSSDGTTRNLALRAMSWEAVESVCACASAARTSSICPSTSFLRSRRPSMAAARILGSFKKVNDMCKPFFSVFPNERGLNTILAYLVMGVNRYRLK